MYSFLSSRNEVLTSAASSWYNMVSAQPAPPLWPYTQLTANYPPGSFTMPVNAMASGLRPFTPSGIQKRQGACTLAPSEMDSGASSTAAEPATILTDLPTLTTGITTPSGSSCVSTFTQTACAPGSRGRSACVTTPACGSWTAPDASTTTSTAPTESSTIVASVSMAIYNDKSCTDLIDTFEIYSNETCAIHIKNNGDAKKFRCFIVSGINEDASEGQLELSVFKSGHCQGDDKKHKVYRDLGSMIDKSQTPFKMGSVNLRAGAA